MGFEAWVEAQGFDPNALSEQQSQSLRALWTQGSTTTDDDRTDPGPAPATRGTTAETVSVSASGMHTTPQPPLSPVDQLRAQWAAERRRIAKISEICGGTHPDIEAQAVEQGWDATQTELAVLRASRPKAPPLHGAPAVASARVLEAAVWLSAKIPEQECLQEFGEQTLDAADPLRQIGLKELVAECARLEGHDVRLRVVRE